MKNSADILLGDASYYGTLAAVRSLGRAGVKVITVDPSRLCHGRYSRFSSQHLTCPPFTDYRVWAEWLSKTARSGTRKTIYATSDAVSFALARYRDELSADLDLYQPDAATIMNILDKGILMQRAQAVGIDTPPTWFPQSSTEAAHIARNIDGAIVVKPRSQLAQRTKSKAHAIQNRADRVAEIFDGYMRDQATHSDFSAYAPESMTPIIQRYYPQASENVYSLCGFRTKDGTQMVMRAARKILQRPRRIGVGLCFEPMSVDPILADKARRLCTSIGYYGVFELEFVMADGKAMLIDFNGRFYNQIALDIARGVDLPALAYAAATNNAADVDQLLAHSNLTRYDDVVGFCNRFGLALTLKVQRILQTMSRREAARWLEWSGGSRGTIIDAVRDSSDSLPAIIDAAQYLLHAARHPRDFARQYGSAISAFEAST